MQNNSSALAEMILETNYSKMSSNGLAEVKSAMLWALNDRIDPLFKTKRMEEMTALTHDYVEKKKELASTQNEEVSGNLDLTYEISMSILGATSEEIQALLEKEMPESSTIKREPVQEQTIAIPASTEENQDEEEALLTALPEAHVEKAESDNEEDSQTSAEVISVEQPSLTDDKETAPEMEKNPAVEQAIALANSQPIPSDVDLNFAYYASYEFKTSRNKLVPTGKFLCSNMGVKALDAMKLTENEHFSHLYRKVDIFTKGDYVVYCFPDSRVVVSEFNKKDGLERPLDLSNVKLPKDIAAKIEFYKDIDRLCKEDEAKQKAEEASTDNLPASDNQVPAPEGTTAESASEPENINPLIQKTVEMTKGLPVTKGTDTSSPYYINGNYSVTEDGTPILEGKPLSVNVNAGEIESAKRSHCKYAKIHKAGEIFLTKDYTAFISQDCKRVSVYCYMSMES